jgi:predicted HNH restriction endonuclease
MEEVKKCIPLCANCHRLVHHDERQAEKALRKRKKP